jgi:hypothetical protein
METNFLVCVMKTKQNEILAKKEANESGFLALFKDTIEFSPNMITFKGDVLIIEFVK